MVPTVTCSPDSSMVTGSNPEAQGSYCFWAMDIIRELGYGRATDQAMVFGTPLDVAKALGGCTCHSDQHSPAAGWSLDNSMTPGGCPAPWHLHVLQRQQKPWTSAQTHNIFILMQLLSAHCKWKLSLSYKVLEWCF